MQEKFPLQCLFLIRVCSRDYVVFRTENIRSKKDAKKAELHRHAGPLYLKDLNGCNGEGKCSFIGTPIFLSRYRDSRG